MGDPAGARRAEARLPGLTRRVLGGIAPLRFGEGHDCTLLATLAIATKSEYDWLMGCSGAAFEVRIDPERWDPLAAAPLDGATRDRAAHAAGVRLDEVAPPWDDEMRELVFARMVEAIDGGAPPLVRGLLGPAEYGLIVGYDTGPEVPIRSRLPLADGAPAGPTVLARTYFDHGAEPSRVGWDAFVDADHGAPVFVDPGRAPEQRVAIAAGIDAGLASRETTDAALRAWIDGLRDDARWTDRAHAGSAAFGDHAMRGLLADRRRAAARFLRRIRGIVPVRAGGDALRAAEAYGQVADAAEKAGVGAFDGAVAMRFLDPGSRRGWANLLESALGREQDAREAMASVRRALD